MDLRTATLRRPRFVVEDIGPFVLAIRKPQEERVMATKPPHRNRRPATIYLRATRANYQIARYVAVVAGLLGAVLWPSPPHCCRSSQTTAQLNWPQNGFASVDTA